ncbi:hypothetical protein BMS3Bbin02_00168 [bacterium BMS3Bbin02]|nr:hypothetical protein BMS3Bbin02_00168 [bacterium BMS3Bbin02]
MAWPLDLVTLQPMKLLRVLVATSLVLAACGGSGATDEPASTYPTGTVREWLVAVSTRDVARLVNIVDQDSLVIVIAIENQIPADDVERMLVQGLAAETIADYWVSFAGAYGTYTGLALDSVTVRGFEQFAVEDIVFARVEVGDDQDPGVVFTRSYDGIWKVDLVATLGDALFPVIEDFVRGIPNGDETSQLRAELREAILPALLAIDSQKPESERRATAIARLGALLTP